MEPQKPEPLAAATPAQTRQGKQARRIAIVQRLVLEHWLELMATFILTVGSLAAAWSGTQASRWGGVQSQAYTLATGRLLQAGQANQLAGQLSLYVTITFDSWISAFRKGETEEAALIERRFRIEFRPAFAAWRASNPFDNPDAPASPLILPEYQSRLAAESIRLEQQAQQHFLAGERANTVSSTYVVIGFMAAVAIFFAGTAPRFTWFPARASMTVLGLLILLWSLWRISTMPIM